MKHIFRKQTGLPALTNIREQAGLTLIETLIATAIFAMVALAIYKGYSTLLVFTRTIRTKTIMTELASEQVEFIRNLSYSDVGTVGGIPNGLIPQTQTVVRNNFTFRMDTTIRNIDNPADGTLGGTPNDLSPADNKLIQIDLTCTSCQQAVATTYTSLVAPKNLETENGNGAIVIKAVDANGIPISDADVTIANTSLSPAVNISDTTDVNGVLTVVDAPPSTQRYQVTVTKSGYSTDRTYLPGASGNPTPTKPHLTVTANTISQSSFAIDRVSTATIKTQSPLCVSIASISGTLAGTKLIGTPSVLKNSVAFTTDGSGTTTLSNLDWDTYKLSISGSTYSVAGTNPIGPVSISPNTSQQITFVLKPAAANRLVVGVVDSTGLPLADAAVSITGPSGTFSGNTTVGSVTQTDWSGGSGQSSMTDWTKFFSNDAGIENVLTPGTIKLVKTGATYTGSGQLVSSTIDFGAATTFRQISWLPVSQPSGIGSTPVRFQIATNNDNATWAYLGPDGTAATYYTTSPADINDVHDGNRYFRYKVFLSSTDSSKTPSITDVSVTYTAGCLPPGQIDFSGLANGTYSETISKSGFATVNKNITISGNTYDTITLTP